MLSADAAVLCTMPDCLLPSAMETISADYILPYIFLYAHGLSNVSSFY